MIFPPPVKPGDRVAVVAPSSPFETVLAFRGLAFLKTRYEVVFEREMFSRSGYLAGSDERRRRELERALNDPTISAIIAARGGYGASRFVHTLRWEVVVEQPKWIVGFSDITAIHLELARVGVASIHGNHVTSLGRGDASARAALVRAMEHPTAPRTFEAQTLAPGSAAGPLVGGNLTLVHACAAARRLQIPEGAVLLLEDVTERPYRIDRMLTTLAAGGHLDRIGAILLGEFTACDPGPDGVRIEDVLCDCLATRGIPVVAGLPIGHGARNEPVMLGSIANVEARKEGARVRFGL
jgi:muramoyltetrapeptide carboxypeptidase